MIKHRANLFLLLILFLFIPINVLALNTESLIGSDVGSTGGANDISGSDGTVDPSSSNGYYHGTDYTGVRITIVDENGKKIKGTRSVDYYYYDMFFGENGSKYENTVLYRLSGETYRTAKINGSTTSLNFVPYARKNNTEHLIYPARPDQVISRTSSQYDFSKKKNWENVNNYLEGVVRKSLSESDSCEQVVNNIFFFKDANYNPCKQKNFDCKQIEKTYIIIEPLLLVNLNQKEVIITAADADYIHSNYYGNYPDLKDKANGSPGVLSIHAYGSMFFNTEGTDYKLNSNGIKYGYFGDNIAPTDRDKYEKCIYKKCSYKNGVWGNGMQAVWLHKIIDRCNECCIPCSIDPTNPNCDKDDCCYDKETLISTGGTPDACISWEEYWDSHDDEHNPDKVCYPEIIIPPPSNPDECPPLEIKPPIASIEVCDDTTDTKKSIFMDGHFSDNYMDFKPLFEATDSIYNDSKVINQYCTKYCQEKVEITLPNNYPTTYAGRFFIWSITGNDELGDNDDNVFVRETIYRNCATNIDLDKWFNDYLGEIADLSTSLSVIGGHASDIPTYATDRQAAYDACKGGGGAANAAANEIIAEMNATTESAMAGFAEAMSNSSNLTEIGWSAFANDTGQGTQGTVVSEQDVNAFNAEHGTTFTIMDSLEFFKAYGEVYAKELLEKATNGDEDSINTIKEANKKRLKPNCEEIISSACHHINNVCDGEGGKLSKKCCVGGQNGCNGIAEITCDGPNPEKSSLYSIIKNLIACEPELADDYTGEYLATNGFGFDSAINQLDIEMGYETFLEMNTFSNYDYDIVSTLEDIVIEDGCNGTPCISDGCDSNIFTSKYCGLSQRLVPKALSGDSSVCTECNNDNANKEDYYFCEQTEKIGYIDNTVYWSEFSKYWNSWIFTKEEVQFDYSLKDNINACICKDGTVIDASADGSCDCPKPETVYEVVSDINTGNYCYFEWKSYTVLPEGSFSVEFMNPTGFYPLYLRYSNIGTKGHFSEFLMSGQLTVNYCSDDGSCYYSDENDICRYSVYNDILNDGGYIEDAICPDGECPPPTCPDGDCNTCGIGECSGGNGKGDTGEIAGMELIYRVIDLDTPFPGSDATGENSSRSPGANWLGTTDGVNPVSDYIENNRGVEGSKLYTSNLEPLYEFTINPAIIKKIRALNAANRDYASLSTMVFDDATIVGGVSYVLRGDLKNIVEGNGGYFSINLDDDYYNRFDLINNNSAIDSSGNLVCRGVSR